MPKTGYYSPKLAPTLHPNLLDIAWAAGIFEGEGSPQRRGPTNLARVIQKDPWLLYRLKNLFGGSVKPTKTGYWNWCLSGPRCRGFLMTIFSFMSPRRKEQIKKIFEVD